MSELKTIMLHGVLADKFGSTFKLSVLTPKEATHAIASQLPEFKKFMLQAEQNGMRFAVFADEKNLGENDIENITGASVIHVVPKIMGAGGDAFGWLQVIGGALLVGAAWFTGGLSVVAAEAMMAAGGGLILGGIASLLMPVPEMPSADEDGNRANYGFGGAVTTVAQNNVVPVLLGERMCGGAIGSAGIYTEDKQ